MATQTSKLGYLKDPETGKIFLPKTTWDSIIGKPDGLNHAYNSKITIRGRTIYPNYTNFGSFTLNQSDDANINLPAFINGNVGLVPQYSLASFSKGTAFLDEKGNWNTALTTGFNDYYIAGAGVNITSAPVIKTYKIDDWIQVSSASSSGPQFCGSINDVAPTLPGIYKFISPYSIIASGFVSFMFNYGPLMTCYYGTSNDNTSKEWIPYNLSDAVEYYFEYKDSNFYFLGTDIHTISTTQIQSNWNESNTNSAAYILNKPTKLSDFTNDLAVTSITAGAGLNTTSNNTSTDGGSITSSGTLHLTKCNNNVGSFGPSSNVSPAHGGNFHVPYITVDKYGRVTSASTRTITLPSAGSSAGTIYSMAAYAMYGDTYGTVHPDVFATAFMYPIINGAVTNDCSIITDKFRIQDYNTSGIDGHVSAAALILLYAAYLSRNGFTSGRLEWETHGYGDYFSYLLCTNTSTCYSVGIDDSAIFQSNGITLYTFNWTGYNNSPLPIGINDYNCDATGIGGTSAKFIAHKYIFTFSNIQQSDMLSLDNVLSAINSDDIDTYTKAAELLNEMLKNGTQSFKSMTVRIEHKSVNQNGFNVFHP